VRVADWLVTVVAPVADAAALYRVPLFAVVRPVSESVVLVALLTFVQVVPASVDDCHWYATAAPPETLADTVRLAEAYAVVCVALTNTDGLWYWYWPARVQSYNKATLLPPETAPPHVFDVGNVPSCHDIPFVLQQTSVPDVARLNAQN